MMISISPGTFRMSNFHWALYFTDCDKIGNQLSYPEYQQYLRDVLAAKGLTAGFNWTSAHDDQSPAVNPGAVDIQTIQGDIPTNLDPLKGIYSALPY